MSIFKITGEIEKEIHLKQDLLSAEKPVQNDLFNLKDNKQDLDSKEKKSSIKNQDWAKNDKISQDDNGVLSAKIAVIGVGGCGGNTILRAVSKGLKNVDYIAINTDSQDLEKLNGIAEKIKIGGSGLGAGSNPEVGRKAAMDHINEIQKIIDPYDAIFLAAGLGGGTGSGATPVIAQMIAETDKLLIASVTAPFPFEKEQKRKVANQALEELKNYVHGLFVVPNEKIAQFEDLTYEESFELSDEVLANSLYAITHALQKTGYINIDFKDVETVIKAGNCDSYVGVSKASGPDRVNQVVDKVARSITDKDLSQCESESALIIISAPKNSLKTKEITEISNLVSDKFSIVNDSKFITGLYDLAEENFDKNNPHIELSVIVSGIKQKSKIAANEQFKLAKDKAIENQANMKNNNEAGIQLKQNKQDKANFGSPLPGFLPKDKPGTYDILKNYQPKHKFEVHKDSFAS